MVRQQGESGVSAVAQVWCSHRGYSGIPCIFCRQSNFLEPCRQVLEERVPERTRSEEVDGKPGLGWLPSCHSDVYMYYVLGMGKSLSEGLHLVQREAWDLEAPDLQPLAPEYRGPELALEMVCSQGFWVGWSAESGLTSAGYVTLAPVCLSFPLC